MSEISTLTQKGRGGQPAPEATRGDVYFTPQVDIYETDKELVLLADLPGVRPEDVDLRFERGELVLHGRVRPRHPETGRLAGEYDVGDFYRVFNVHESIDAGKISAEMKNGVLTVHLPKVAAAQPRQINVRAQ